METIAIMSKSKKHLRKNTLGQYESDKVYCDSIVLLPDGTIRGEKLDLSGHIRVGSWKRVKINKK